MPAGATVWAMGLEVLTPAVDRCDMSPLDRYRWVGKGGGRSLYAQKVWRAAFLSIVCMWRDNSVSVVILSQHRTVPAVVTMCGLRCRYRLWCSVYPGISATTHGVLHLNVPSPSTTTCPHCGCHNCAHHHYSTNVYRWTKDAYEAVHLNTIPHKRLTAPVRVFDFDFGGPSGTIPPREAMLHLTAVASGTLNAVAFWFDLQLGEGIAITTGRRVCYCQYFHVLCIMACMLPAAGKAACMPEPCGCSRKVTLRAAIALSFECP